MPCKEITQGIIACFVCAAGFTMWLVSIEGPGLGQFLQQKTPTNPAGAFFTDTWCENFD